MEVKVECQATSRVAGVGTITYHGDTDTQAPHIAHEYTADIDLTAVVPVGAEIQPVTGGTVACEGFEYGESLVPIYTTASVKDDRYTLPDLKYISGSGPSGKFVLDADVKASLRQGIWGNANTKASDLERVDTPDISIDGNQIKYTYALANDNKFKIGIGSATHDHVAAGCDTCAGNIAFKIGDTKLDSTSGVQTWCPNEALFEGQNLQQVAIDDLSPAIGYTFPDLYTITSAKRSAAAVEGHSVQFSKPTSSAPNDYPEVFGCESESLLLKNFESESKLIERYDELLNGCAFPAPSQDTWNDIDGSVLFHVTSEGTDSDNFKFDPATLPNRWGLDMIVSDKADGVSTLSVAYDTSKPEPGQGEVSIAITDQQAVLSGDNAVATVAVTEQFGVALTLDDSHIDNSGDQTYGGKTDIQCADLTVDASMEVTLSAPDLPSNSATATATHTKAKTEYSIAAFDNVLADESRTVGDQLEASARKQKDMSLNFGVGVDESETLNFDCVGCVRQLDVSDFNCESQSKLRVDFDVVDAFAEPCADRNTAISGDVSKLVKDYTVKLRASDLQVATSVQANQTRLDSAFAEDDVSFSVDVTGTLVDDLDKDFKIRYTDSDNVEKTVTCSESPCEITYSKAVVHPETINIPYDVLVAYENDICHTGAALSEHVAGSGSASLVITTEENVYTGKAVFSDATLAHTNNGNDDARLIGETDPGATFHPRDLSLRSYDMPHGGSADDMIIEAVFERMDSSQNTESYTMTLGDLERVQGPCENGSCQAVASNSLTIGSNGAKVFLRVNQATACDGSADDEGRAAYANVPSIELSDGTNNRIFRIPLNCPPADDIKLQAKKEDGSFEDLDASSEIDVASYVLGDLRENFDEQVFVFKKSGGRGDVTKNIRIEGAKIVSSVDASLVGNDETQVKVQTTVGCRGDAILRMFAFGNTYNLRTRCIRWSNLAQDKASADSISDTIHLDYGFEVKFDLSDDNRIIPSETSTLNDVIWIGGDCSDPDNESGKKCAIERLNPDPAEDPLSANDFMTRKSSDGNNDCLDVNSAAEYANHIARSGTIVRNYERGDQNFCQSRDFTVAVYKLGQATATIRVDSVPEVDFLTQVESLGWQQCAGGYQMRLELSADYSTDGKTTYSDLDVSLGSSSSSFQQVASGIGSSVSASPDNSKLVILGNCITEDTCDNAFADASGTINTHFELWKEHDNVYYAGDVAVSTTLKGCPLEQVEKDDSQKQGVIEIKKNLGGGSFSGVLDEAARLSLAASDNIKVTLDADQNGFTASITKVQLNGADVCGASFSPVYSIDCAGAAHPANGFTMDVSPLQGSGQATILIEYELGTSLRRRLLSLDLSGSAEAGIKVLPASMEVSDKMESEPAAQTSSSDVNLGLALGLGAVGILSAAALIVAVSKRSGVASKSTGGNGYVGETTGLIRKGRFTSNIAF